LRSTLGRLCRILTRSPVLDIPPKPAIEVAEAEPIIAAPEAAPAAPHA